MIERICVLMATKDRLETLKITLAASEFLISNERVNFIILDDGSTDGTSEFIITNYPEIKILKNAKSRGIHYCRNILYNSVNTRFAITIDDDINFLNTFELDEVIDYFDSNPDCAVMAFRIFWGKNLPSTRITKDTPCKVKSFGAGGHAIRISSLKKIPPLPEWFLFYGEEDFLAIELFKIKKYVYYTPRFFVHHRVDLKERKENKDYIERSRRSLRSGWYLLLLFVPWKYIPRKFLYSLAVQYKRKVLIGDFKAWMAILKAKGDVGCNFLKLIRNRRPLTEIEYREYHNFPDAKLYWKPEN